MRPLTKNQKLGGTVAVIAIAAWAGLFLSNHGVLVWASTDETPLGAEVKTCHYFTGTGIEDKKQLSLGELGRESCPRWLSLD